MKLVALALLSFSSSLAYATASFNGFAQATLEVISISTSDPNFYITIDPFGQDPVFNIVETEETNSSGGGSATATALAELLAEEPFNVQVGERLRVEAAASGSTAAPLPASADALALPIIGLSMRNETDGNVTVFLSLSYALSTLVGVDDPLLETAMIYADVSVGTGGTVGASSFPAAFADSLIDESGTAETENMLFQYIIAPGESGFVQLSTAVSGMVTEQAPEINGVPSPGTLFLLGLGLAGLSHLRRKQTKMA